MNGKCVYVEKGDVIIGKILTKSNKNGEEEIFDNSYVIQSGEEGFIDRVIETVTPNGYKMIKVVIRNQKIPEIGDKGASRSAQKGTVGLLIPQEDMPFASNGITPDILINSHCISGDTKIFLTNGLSRRVDSFSQHGLEKLLTLSDDTKKFELSFSLGMESKGIQNVIKLTMIDGRELVCTPDHKIKVFKDGEYLWKESQNIDYNDKIVMGIEGTLDTICENEKTWSLKLNGNVFSMKTNKDREKSLAFARILGFLYTDGCICETSGTHKCIVNMSCLFDSETILDDIFIITGKRPTITIDDGKKFGVSYNIGIPLSLVKSVISICDIVIGRKTTQIYKFPSFLYDDNCPKSIIREFLAACFGGDGWKPYIDCNVFSTVYFSKSVLKENEEIMVKEYEKFVGLLFKLGVESKISRIRENNDNKFVSIYIKIASNSNFKKYIGFRHCVDKSLRLEIASSYEEYSKQVKIQHNDMFNLINYYIDIEKMTHNEALINARKEYYKDKHPLNTYYSLFTKNLISNRRKIERTNNVDVLKYKYMENASRYCKILGCSEWFNKNSYVIEKNQTTLPHYYMSILKKQEIIDDIEVFDIGVSKYHNFIANGINISNCIPSRMTIAQLLETVLGKACCLEGKLGDGTPFTSNSTNVAENICNKLAKEGYEKHGNEVLYNGMTGEMIEAQIMIGPVFYQRLKHMVSDKIHCLDFETEVLTLNGWKTVFTLNKDDLIATLKDGKLIYEKPIDIMVYKDYEGSMYYIKNNFIDFAVTGNHRMWVSKYCDNEWQSYNFERADEIIGKHRKYKKDAVWDVSDYQFNLSGEPKNLPMNEWLIFFGILYIKGWFSDCDKYVYISVDKSMVKEYLFTALDKLKFNSFYKDEKIYFEDEQLYRYMKLQSIDILPSWVFNLSKEQTQVLIKGMILGNEYYDTKSVVLADQFQQLCLHAGWSGDIIKKKESNIDTIRISVIKTDLCPLVNYEKNTQTEKYIEKVKCPVFCLQVQSEVFYIRRNGKCAWTANSRSQGPVTSLFRQPLEGYIMVDIPIITYFYKMI